MNVYSCTEDLLYFSTSYSAKRLLDDSVDRTDRGIQSLFKGEVLTGSGNILLGRIESATAFCFVALSASFAALACLVISPLLLGGITVLNVCSRLPGVSMSTKAQEFTKYSDDILYRAARAHLVALPAIFLFLATAGVNTLLPGVIHSDSFLFESIHSWVSCLGDLETFRAVAGRHTAEGTSHELSILEALEEYLRTLSNKNYIQEKHVASFNHIRRVSNYHGY